LRSNTRYSGKAICGQALTFHPGAARWMISEQIRARLLFERKDSKIGIAARPAQRFIPWSITRLCPTCDAKRISAFVPLVLRVGHGEVWLKVDQDLMLDANHRRIRMPKWARNAFARHSADTAEEAESDIDGVPRAAQ